MNTSAAYQQHMTTELDPQFESANQVTAFPWVGKNYRHSEILILGHTAHSKEHIGEHLGQDFNRKVATWCWDEDSVPFPEDHGSNAHADTAKMFVSGAGRTYNRENQIAFWESVAFTNYCQCFVETGKHVGASCPCDKESKQATTQAIAILKPKLVIAWTSDPTKMGFSSGQRVMVKNNPERDTYAQIIPGTPLVVGVPHPSMPAGKGESIVNFLKTNEATQPHIAKLVQYLSTVLKK